MRALCGEPFCYTPAEAARVTDYQFRELVVKPALRRRRRRKSRRLPTREQYVAQGLALNGALPAPGDDPETAAFKAGVRERFEQAYSEWVTRGGNS